MRSPLSLAPSPCSSPPHQLGPEKEAEVDRQVQDLSQRGMIVPGSGAWSSPVALVRKKDGAWRFCVDYHQLNEITEADAFPLPQIDNSLDALSGSKYFSTPDLASGYWQVPLVENAPEKAVFVTRGDLWKWKVPPFELTSAPPPCSGYWRGSCTGTTGRPFCTSLYIPFACKTRISP